MHDLDRPFLEMEEEALEETGFETEEEYDAEAEAEADLEAEGEGEDEDEGEADHEADYEGEGEGEGEYEAAFAAETEEGILTETEVQELAAELLGVSSEVELDQFLGTLIKNAAKVVGSSIPSPVGQALRAALRKVARRGLPVVGAALGNAVAPGVGGAIGGKLASAAGSMFGLELEGFSHEDGEFEVSKQFVRLGADMTASAVLAAGSGVGPRLAVKEAAVGAAQKYAPGLLEANLPAEQEIWTSSSAGRQQGRWYRRGNRIVLVGM